MTTQAAIARFFRELHPAFIPAAVIVGWTTLDMALRYSKLPWIDQWQFLDECRALLSHGFSLAWLFASHNGHRMATSRPLYLIDLFWFGGHNTFLILCIWVIQVAGTAVFVKLRGNLRQTQNAFALAFAIGTLFSLGQWQNFLQGFQTQFVGVFALGAWCVTLFVEGLLATTSWRSRLVSATVLLALATFTMANGFLAGAASAVVGLLMRRRLWASFGFGILTCCLAWLYIQGPDIDHPPLATMLSVQWVCYIATYLGGIWGLPQPGPINDAALVSGLLGLLMTASAVIRVAANPRDPRRAALLAIMIYVVLSAMLTGLGRVSRGIDQAIDSRYLTSSAYFWSAAVIYWTGEVQDGTTFLARTAKLSLGLALCFLLLPMQLSGDFVTTRYQIVVNRAGSYLLRHEDARAVLILSNGDVNYFALLAPTYELNVDLLRRRHLSIFANEPAPPLTK